MSRNQRDVKEKKRLLGSLSEFACRFTSCSSRRKFKFLPFHQNIRKQMYICKCSLESEVVGSYFFVNTGRVFMEIVCFFFV